MFKTFQEVEAFFKDRGKYGIKPGLERIHALLDHLGNPERDIKAIHIAGTNGKGSTAQYIKDALLANGYKVGMFTSPSFSGLCGYYFLNKEQIDQVSLIKLVNEIYPVVSMLDAQNMHPTEFEIITAIAFLYFKNEADLVVIEACMGGREDTTNCFIPLVSVITNVSLDHVGFLGSTVKEIAYQKAGIIKKNRPIVAGDLEEEALEVIRKEAVEQDAPLYIYGQDFSVHIKDAASRTFTWFNQADEFDIELGMLGTYQVVNATTALKTLAVIDKMGIKLDWDQIINSFKQTVLPGRFERIVESPVMILDGAHNPAGIRSFVQAVRNFSTSKKREILFAAFQDKDLHTMLTILTESHSNIILTTFDHPRAVSEKMLRQLKDQYNLKMDLDWQAHVSDCLSNPTVDTEYYITGSLNFIVQVRDYILHKINR